jgi:TRAP-type uncharacterized transport system substrate-binding protein
MADEPSRKDAMLLPSRRWMPGRPATWFGGVATALILLAIAATVMWLGSVPPRVVVMSTGEEGSDYAVLATRYQSILRRSGVELRLLPSDGDLQNLERLSDPKSGVTVGFAEGGLTGETLAPDLESLGTMFFQPFWFFSRVPTERGLDGLRGKAVSLGLEGSGTRALALRILRLNGIDPGILNVRALSPAQAARALLQGEITAAAIATSWDSPLVRQLLASSDVNVVGFPRADAYVALYPYLRKLRLPEGVGNLATNRPPGDVALIAPKASLIVRRDLHPAIQYLLLEAASEIHSGDSIFQQSGTFPAAERGDLPLSKAARQYYRTGPPFLQRYLPFWLAVWVSQVLVLLIPVLGVAYPVLRLAPGLYYWTVRHRIFQLYGELKVIETELEGHGATATEAVFARLQRLEERAHRLRVPHALAETSYTLRMHIRLVRDRLARHPSATIGGGDFGGARTIRRDLGEEPAILEGAPGAAETGSSAGTP